MAFEVRSELPGLEPEAKRCLVEVQTAIRREFDRHDQRSSRPKRKVTQLNEQNVIAKPGEVVRVKPGEHDITVYLPEPEPGNAGEDIIVNVEGDGTQTGRVNVEPLNGTCDNPGIVQLNSPGSYRYTSTGASNEGEAGGAWTGPPPIAVEDIPASVAGDGLQGGGGVPLAVDVSDFAGTGLEDDGSENIRIATSAAGDGIQGGGGVALAVDVSDFAGTGLEDDGSENLRIAAAAAGAGLIGGGGSALAVGAGTNVTVNANDVAVVNFPLSGLATQADQTGVANKSGGVAAPVATALGTYLSGITADVVVSSAAEVRVNAPGGVAVEACASPSTSIGLNDLCINADGGVSINAGAQQVAVSNGNVELRATVDLLLNGVQGAALESMATPSVAVATGDVVINADGGIGVRAGVTAITSVTNGTLDVQTAGNATLALGADLIVNALSGVNITADAAAAGSAVGTGVIALNAPTNGIALTAGLAEVNLAGAGDIKLNASSGVRVHAGATAETTASGIELSSDTSITSTSTTFCRQTSTTDTQIAAGSGVNIRAGSTTALGADDGDVLVNATGGIGLIAGASTLTGVTGNDIRLIADADIGLAGASGVNISGGHAVGAADAGDVVLNATSGIRLHQGATPVTGGTGVQISTDTDVLIEATDDITINPTDDLVLQTNGTTRARINAAGDWDYENALDFDVTGAAAIDATGNITLTTSGVGTDILLTALTTCAASAAQVVLNSTNTEFRVNVNGCAINGVGFLQIEEEASSTLSNPDGIGSYWVLNLAPNEAMFTDDDDNDWRLNCSGVASNSAITTISAAQTTITPATFTIPANSLRAGSCYELDVMGVFVRGATATALNIVADLMLAGAGARGLVSAALTTAGSYHFHIKALINILTTGSSGTYSASIQLHSDGAVALGDTHAGSTNITSNTIDTTVSNTLAIRCNMSATVAATSLTVNNAIIKKVF